MLREKRLFAYVILAGVLLLWLPGKAFAQDVMEENGQCRINWTKKVILCTGKGSPNLKKARNVSQARLLAEQAAKIDAMRNILETLKGVKISAGITVGEKIDKDHKVRTEIQGVLRNFTVVATRYYSDGGVEVDVKMPLDGKLTQVLFKDELKKQASNLPSGVVVVAKGKKLVPVLAPRILDDKGNVIYSASMVSEAGAKNGIVAYHGSVDDAKTDLRVADNPVVVKAVAVKDSVDVVVSSKDAKKIKELESKYHVLSQGRVVFVK